MVFVRGEGSQCWFRHVRSHWTAFVKPLAPSSIEYFDIGMPVVVEDPPDAGSGIASRPIVCYYHGVITNSHAFHELGDLLRRSDKWVAGGVIRKVRVLDVVVLAYTGGVWYVGAALSIVLVTVYNAYVGIVQVVFKPVGLHQYIWASIVVVCHNSLPVVHS